MTPYETAALWLQELSIWATVGVGLLYALLICAGLWIMHRASSDRNRAMDAQERESKRRHDEAMESLDRRHDEAMESLDRRHSEAMESLDRRHDESRSAHEETMAALAAQRRALEALIERTAPRAAPAE